MIADYAPISTIYLHYVFFLYWTSHEFTEKQDVDHIFLAGPSVWYLEKTLKDFKSMKKCFY